MIVTTSAHSGVWAAATFPRCRCWGRNTPPFGRRTARTARTARVPPGDERLADLDDELTVGTVTLGPFEISILIRGGLESPVLPLI